MHPIERLRYVARASGADQAALASETAEALAHFREDPRGLVTACRRVVGRQPLCGSLWWLCSRVLCASDPLAEAWAAVDLVESDATARVLEQSLPEDASVCVVGWPELAGRALRRRGDVGVKALDVLDEGSALARYLTDAGGDAQALPPRAISAAVLESDILLVEASLAGPDGFIAVAPTRAAAATARHGGVEVWLVAGTGRVLPLATWQAATERLGPALGSEDELVPADLVSAVAGPAGLEAPPGALADPGCPVAPELCRAL